ncbi:MAG: DUF2156 domain-containing protein [Wujia sp.]
MEFIKPSIRDAEIIRKKLNNSKYPACELATANIILWSEYYGCRYAFMEDMLVFCKLENGKPVSFSWPYGEGDSKKAFDFIVNYFEKAEKPFSMYLVGQEMFEQIDSWYPGEYQIEYDRDDADYLYLSETLASLKGKKLHGKRNHINRFLEYYPDYEYERITENNIVECEELAQNWMKNNNEESAGDINYEYRALCSALNNMEALGLIGAMIRIDGKACAFTIGEELNAETFVVHFEKAYADIQGAYPMINREFVRRELLGKYKYVNREEDMGIPGLRHAKTSYQPIQLVEKGIVRRKVNEKV